MNDPTDYRARLVRARKMALDHIVESCQADPPMRATELFDVIEEAKKTIAVVSRELGEVIPRKKRRSM